MISHYYVKAIFMSENNFSHSYNFSLVRRENRYKEVKYQKRNYKKKIMIKDYTKIIFVDNELYYFLI